MKISIIITTFNEGDEVKKTVDNLRENTDDCEIIVVDDASTDGSCDKVAIDQYIIHDERVGIAPSRIEGVAVARGDVFAFFDAHQRITPQGINQCADLALERQAIVWPCLTGLGNSRWMGHGANMVQKDNRKAGLFEGRWRRTKPIDTVSRSSTMIVPGYVIPKTVWPKVALIPGLAIHGASEPALTVKAFFTDTDILHLCGPVARHLFRAGTKLPFSCAWRVTARNHALVARICFSQKTWDEYWWPRVFKRHIKGENARDEFENGLILEWHKEFQKLKVRPDEEFWRGLIQEPRKNRI